MQVVRYRPDRLIARIPFAALVMLGGGWIAAQSDMHWHLRLIGGMGAFAMPFVIIEMLYRLRNNAYALYFDATGVGVRTSSASNFAWREVRAIERTVQTQHGLGGLFKHEIARFLTFSVVDNNGLARQIDLQEDLLDLPEDRMNVLVYQLTACWRSALPS